MTEEAEMAQATEMERAIDAEAAPEATGAVWVSPGTVERSS
jgi:hypothetical protein